MTFQERLANKKKQVEGNIPPRFLKIMHNATRVLERSGIQNNVIKVGAQLPDFTLLNQNNQQINASEYYTKGPLVITFYRGFWCSYCNLDLANLKHYVPEIESLGASMLTISPEKSEYSKKIIAMQKLDFDILWDKNNRLAEKFGLKYNLPLDLKELYRDSFHINLKQYHGDDEWALPMPARFLVDIGGIIRYAEFSADYTKRPDPDDLIAVLKSL